MTPRIEFERMIIGTALAFPDSIPQLAEGLVGYAWEGHLEESTWRTILKLGPATSMDAVYRAANANGNYGLTPSQLREAHEDAGLSMHRPEQRSHCIRQMHEVATFEKLRKAATADNPDPKRVIDELQRILDKNPAVDEQDDSFADAFMFGDEIDKVELAPLEPILGDGLIAKGLYALLIGGKGLGKSWIALDVAAKVATGQPFFGWPTTQCRVGVISLEMLRSEMLRRLADIGHPDRIPNLGIMGIDSFRQSEQQPNAPDWPRLLDPKIQNAIIRAVRQRQIGLLVIDPIGRTITGAENEELAGIADWVNWLCVRENIAALLAHHPAKGEQGKARTGAQAARGPSQLTDWASVILELKKSKGCFRLAVPDDTGPRYCATPDPIWLKRVQPSGKFEQTSAPEDASAKAENTRAQLMDKLCEGPVYPAQEAKRLGLTPETIRKHLKGIGAAQEGRGPGARWELSRQGHLTEGALLQ